MTRQGGTGRRRRLISSSAEGRLYALPQDRCVVDAARLAAVIGDARPVPRVSPYFGYAPLDPAHLADSDGMVFVRDVPRR